jgi:hypothetical protein
MATEGGYLADEPQNFDARSQVARSLCANGRHERAHRPFWQFLDGLTWALLGGPFDETSDRWGWSNLLKIGWSGGNPEEWPSPIKPKLIDDQRSACVASLRDEFEELHDSLVVIVSSNTFGVLDNADLFPQLVPGWQDKYDDNWNKDYESSTGVWSFKDTHSRNLYIHAEHPRRAVSAIKPYWGSALGRIIHLARTMMPNLA